MDKQAILSKAESDKRVRHCLQLLRDILNISEKYNGQCFLSLDFFTQKYDISERTFYLWKKRLLECGYIKSAKKGYYISVNTELKTVISCENVQHIAVESAKETETACSLTEECCTITETACSLTATSCSPIYKQKTNYKQTKTKERGDFIALPSHLNPADNLQITQTEFDKLVATFGQEKVLKELPNFSSWLYDNPKRSKNNYLSLIRWLGKEWPSSALNVQKSKKVSPYC
jgi:hypothetical protein